MINKDVVKVVGKVKNRSGAALVTALIAMVVLALVIAGVTSLATSGSRLTLTNRDHAEALYVAESGIVRTMVELPKHWTNPESISRSGSTGAGDYTINNIEFYPSGPSTSTAYVIVTSSARVISSQAGDRATRTVKVWLSPNWPQYFSYGLCALSENTGAGKEPLRITGGGLVDGYRSLSGLSYEEQVANAEHVQPDPITGERYAESAVGIATNGDAKCIGGSVVFGSLNITEDGSFHGTGFTDNPTTLTDAVALKDFDTSLYVNNNDNNLIPSGYNATTKTLTVNSGAIVTLPAGNSGIPRIYYFSSMTVKGELRVGTDAEPGPVIIYVEGKIDVQTNGSIVNMSKLPPNLMIFCNATAKDGVTIAGNADFYGGIYAPYAQVKLTGGFDFYGSVTGDRIDFSGEGDFHYDKDLTNVKMGNPTGFAVSKWIELEPIL